MTSNKITFTIITVCYNSVSTLEKTIKSVIQQQYKNYEYIVIDGNSNDGTIELINKYKKHINVIVSEPDKGIYDAINKGIKLSKGKYISILNSDDTYNPDTLKTVFETIKDDKTDAIVYGNTYFIDKNDAVFDVDIGCFNPNKLTSGIGFMHPASFVPKKVYNNIGLYSLSKSLYIAGDADFLLRCYKKNVKFVKSNFSVFMRTGGLSENYFYTAHIQYLKTLKNYKIINNGNYFFNRLKLLIKLPIKKVFSRKKVANIKLQLWVILVAIFNFTLKYTPFTFLKKKILQVFGFEIGKSSYIHNSTFLSLGKLKIGNNSVINPKCVIDNRGEITIGNNVSIGHYSKIYTTGHRINCSYFTGVKKPVVIKNNAVLFSSCIIQPGVTIGEGAVVFTGAVVTKDVPDFSLVGGNPAKIVGKRSAYLNYKIDYGFKYIK